ncbi:MAG: FkbM family methyltransferase [Mucilaginibacter sp.]|nr:FkbM family methyltransferase [Mucilaginibacter sp.]
MKRIIRKILYTAGYTINKVKLKSRKTKDLTLHNTATGNYYLPTHAYGDIVANTIKNNQIFEKEVVDIAYKYIKEDTAVLDVGSNFGQMSILFANKVGDKGTVYAFDADDFVYEILVKNIAANNKEGKIIPTFGAIHNIDNEILFFPEQDFEVYGAYGSYGIDYNSTKGREVKSVTIDSLNIQQPISFMKIDIQGGDLQAMQGAIKTIEKNQMPILFEYEYHFEDDFNLSFQEYVDFVRDIGYVFKKVINGHNFLIVPKA